MDMEQSHLSDSLVKLLCECTENIYISQEKDWKFVLNTPPRGIADSIIQLLSVKKVIKIDTTIRTYV